MKGPDDEEDDDVQPSYYDDDEHQYNRELDDMKERHPGYSEESYRAGKFLGVDFPYVPGDPFW